MKKYLKLGLVVGIFGVIVLAVFVLKFGFNIPPDQTTAAVISGTTSLAPAPASSGCVPNTWTQKANFGGGEIEAAIGFSINTNGYIGTGFNGLSDTKDFWLYDSLTNAWTQKADFGGGLRYGAVGFAIGNKGYVGTGTVYNSGAIKKDFWEYNPTMNAWTQKADFGGGLRTRATGFSINNKGYIGTGLDGFIATQDFWEYNPNSLINGLDVNGNPMGAWIQKANFLGGPRWDSASFSINTNGYIGTGFNGSALTQDFYEYKSTTGIWIPKANFGGTARSDARGFSIGNKGYIGTGYDGTDRKDFWQYDSILDTWAQKADLGGAIRDRAVGFSIGTKGYLGTGESPYLSDFWEYCPDLPDLKITDDLKWTDHYNNTIPVANQNYGQGSVYHSSKYVYFKAVVKNIGTAPLLTNNMNFKLYKNSIAPANVYGQTTFGSTGITIAPGSTYTLYFTNSVPVGSPGSNNLILVGDTANIVTESDETNNTSPAIPFTVI